MIVWAIFSLSSSDIAADYHIGEGIAMTKDGIREMVSRNLRRAYDNVLTERIPDEMTELLRKLA